MALQGELGRDKLCCFICEDLMKNPVIIPCGHSYCLCCICRCWDGEKQKKIHSCPQCSQTFEQRYVLMKNTMLAELVEEGKNKKNTVGLKKKKKKTEPKAGPSDPCDAGPGDVGCDICSPPGRKRKALKSCLQCRVSFCEQHLQPHYEVPFKKHKLIEASKLQENICSQHDKVMEIFCRTDQQCICILCSMDEHKGHDTVSAAAEMAEKKKELGVSRQNIHPRIQNKEKVVKLLQQEVEDINLSAVKDPVKCAPVHDLLC